ncbi:unnamed protein product [Hymenolepis diminuta]|uniref:Nucleotide-diphospho-sugar transferase domain-containing protein n=1 Tax=Hymenolepis diminuta TaxID=6216 RepID=A0A564XZ21_HYMDI|nr:unnamed protein product [Hymenolepis diminuta]
MKVKRMLHNIFLKSLIWHHFEEGGENAAPIHLHLLADSATKYILEGILASWRINKLRFTFYAAEPFQAISGWLRSHHPATKISTMKMYAPAILNYTVSKIIMMDTDCLFMTDITRLWDHFNNFRSLQVGDAVSIKGHNYYM